MTTGKSYLYNWLWSPGHMYLSIFYWHPIIRERAVRNLKYSLGEHVDQEGQPHNPREQFNVMDSSTLLHNFLLILGDTTWIFLGYRWWISSKVFLC